MLGQVGQQDGQVKADGLGRLVVGLFEDCVVNLALVVFLATAQQELDFLPKDKKPMKACTRTYL